jgi:threonine/homoserine/homoserine lactone efflux protein
LKPEKDPSIEQVPIGKPMITIGGKRKSRSENDKSNLDARNEEKRGGFANGLAVGVGIGFIATFVVMWIAVFFSPQLPAGTTYQTMLSIFIYPLVYLLAVGSITLTAGIVREYYTQRSGRTQL